MARFKWYDNDAWQIFPKPRRRIKMITTVVTRHGLVGVADRCQIITRQIKVFGATVWSTHWIVLPNKQVVRLRKLEDDAFATKLTAQAQTKPSCPA